MDMVFDHPPLPTIVFMCSAVQLYIVLQFILDAFDAHELGFENCGLKFSLGGLRMELEVC